MNDHDYHLDDADTPNYLWTADTLDQDAAMAMSEEEFKAEMKRLQIRAQRRSRKPAHRRALTTGAARLTLTPRLHGTDEPDLSELVGGDDIPPSAWHPTLERHAVEAHAVTHARYPELSPAAAYSLGIYLDLVSVGEIARPVLDYERTRARLAEYVTQNASDPAVLAQRNTSTTMAFLVGGAV